MRRVAWMYRGAGILVAVALLGLSLPTSARSQTLLKFGVAAVNEGMLPIRVAIDQGYLKAAGMTAEFIDFKGGGPTVQGFAGGSVDFCVCAADHVLRLANRGFDARIISGLDEFHSYVLVAKADAPFTDISSLKGKRVGITSPGSFTDNTVRWTIGKAGLNAQRDYQLIGAGIGAAMRAAIETGQVDAGVVIVTELPSYLRTGKFKVVVDWRPTRYAALVVIGRQRWADANPQLASGLAQSIAKAAQLIQADAAVAKQGVKALYPHFTDEQAQETADAARMRLSKDGSVAAQGFETMIEVVMASDATLKRVSQAEVDLQPKLAK